MEERGTDIVLGRFSAKLQLFVLIFFCMVCIQEQYLQLALSNAT